MKLTRSREQLGERLGWVADFSDTMVKVIGGLEVLAGIGLIVPTLVNVAPVLAPLAAVGLVLLMVGAAVVHGRRGETQMITVNVVLLVIAAFVAWARFGSYAL
ncbi:MAG TPA: DoxX family protein [Euzebyales bacterium]|nr:DoxX family protein [Euzebyales bacterium]